MDSAAELLASISPVITLPGYTAFRLALERTAELLRTRSSDQIRMTKDIYPGVARSCRLTIPAAERQIYRAVECCWNDGDNPALHAVIGRKFSVKPPPRDLLLYCAYYLQTGTPYHSPAGAGTPLF